MLLSLLLLYLKGNCLVGCLDSFFALSTRVAYSELTWVWRLPHNVFRKSYLFFTSDVCVLRFSFFSATVHLYYYLRLLQGFDEYMNLVLDDAEELNVKKKTKKSLGKSICSSTFLCCVLLVDFYCNYKSLYYLFDRADPSQRRQYYSDDEYVSEILFSFCLIFIVSYFCFLPCCLVIPPVYFTAYNCYV